MRSLILADYVVRSRAGGPRRYLDASEAGPDVSVLSLRSCADDDEAEDYFRRRPGNIRRIWEAARLLLRHWHLTRGAGTIYCLDGMFFNLLLAAARVGLLDTRGKHIRRFAFHDQAKRRLLPWLRRAPEAFAVDLITSEQTRRWGGAVGARHVRLLRWRIDTDWYQPAASALSGPWFLPGHARRDDALIRPLLEAGLPVTRAGRSFALAEKLGPCAALPGFKLMINAPHEEYRAALRGARAVLLPILPCGEPAGLTAAMEALACAVPVLANHSMGIAELFAGCDYPLPLLQNLEPGAWITACRELDGRLRDPALRASLEHSRRQLIARHSIRPGNGDWLEVLQTRSPRHDPAMMTEPR